MAVCQEGLQRLARNEAEQARAAFASALAADPQETANTVGLAEALRRLGRLAEAESLLCDLLRRDPQNAGAWSNLAVVHLTQSRRDDAVRALRRASELDPGSFPAHLNLAAALFGAGCYAEAEASARAAIDLQPSVAMAHCALANILRGGQRVAEAEAAYRRALELDPNAREAVEGLAGVLATQGDTGQAVRLLVDLGRRTGAAEYLLEAAMLQPPIPASAAEIEESRQRTMASLVSAAQAQLQFANPYRTPSTFYLAYQGRNDRPVMEALDAVLTASAPRLSHVASHRPTPRAGGRARIGFVSQFFHVHTIGRVFKGLLQQLDRTRFEVVVAHLPHSRDDELRREINAAADRVLDLPQDLFGQRQTLEAAGLDLLFFADIGMTAASYALARARLAPVQAVGWGHPSTTGLRTIDHFVSWDLAEPAGAESHYTERLVRLPRLACYYEPPAAVPPLDRQAAGLPDAGRLYGCLQSLFKLHPDFDSVLAGIVARDPTGWLIFAQGQHPAWEALLRRRWAGYGELNARAVFLPRRPFRDYLATLPLMDVLLDPIHFGSGTTFYDAMGEGLPVVTWPGEFSRGRIVSAAYRQMGAGDGLVAPRLEDYAARAVAVADAEQGELRARLRATARAELFADGEAVRAFERYLLEAVGQVGA